jgi:hypothetical protein
MDPKVVDHNVAVGLNQEGRYVEEEDKVTAGNKRREIQFKASHALLIAFFLWILYVHTSTKIVPD